MTPAEAIEAAELAEAESRYRNELAREMAAAAFERGHLAGRVQAAADIKAVQHGIVLDAKLDAARSGPGGREHFADPRPGDFPGRAGRRELEPELEAEIA